MSGTTPPPSFNSAPISGLELIELGVAHRIARFIAVPIIQRLDASSRRGIITRNSNFQLGAISKFQRPLYKPFSETTCTHDHGTIEILKPTRNDFTGRGTIAVDQDHQWDFEVDRLVLCFVFLIEFFDFRFGRHDELAFGHE